MDPKKVVEQGYDEIAGSYLRARGKVGSEEFLTDLVARLHDDATVLDVGCGPGVPLTKFLSEKFHVVGVDISAEQIRRARELVPQATFHRMDMTALDFPDESFDAICSLYAIFHVPRHEHSRIFKSFYRVLKSSGHILVTMGARDTEQGLQEDWFGAPMYWSSFGPEKSLETIRDASFEILSSKVVSHADIEGEGEETHLFILARRR